MIGTIEALGVFVLAVLPGFVALRAYSLGKPTFRTPGALAELGEMLVVSAVAWAALYLWRGEFLLPIVLGGEPTGDRLDAFAELAALSILIGLVLGVVARLIGDVIRRRVIRNLTTRERKSSESSSARPRRSQWWQRLVARLSSDLRARLLPGAAWDRLMARLANRGEPVLCRVHTRSGTEVLGTLASAGYADWEADGRGLLLDAEVVRNAEGLLQPLPSSQGVFIPGDEISMLSVVSLPDVALDSAVHGGGKEHQGR